MAMLEEPIKGVKEVKNYINGEWVDSKGQIVDVVNPATGKVIGKCPISTREEIDAAVQAAKAAFPDWRRTTPLARTRILFRLKDLLEENFEEVSRIQTMEHGKTIDESRGDETGNRKRRSVLRHPNPDAGLLFRGYRFGNR